MLSFGVMNLPVTSIQPVFNKHIGAYQFRRESLNDASENGHTVPNLEFVKTVMRPCFDSEIFETPEMEICSPEGKTITVFGQIGSSKDSEIRLAVCEGQYYCMKILKTTDFEHRRNWFWLNVNRNLDVKNVLPLHCSGVLEDGRLFAILELDEGITYNSLNKIFSLRSFNTAGCGYFHEAAVQEYIDERGFLALPPEARMRIDLALFHAALLGCADASDVVCNIEEQGLLHKDIAPSNLLLKVEEGNFGARVYDFGSAMALSDSTNVESPPPTVYRFTDNSCNEKCVRDSAKEAMSLRTYIGSYKNKGFTPTTAAPEVVAGMPVLGKSDIRALAATMFVVFNGQEYLHSSSGVDLFKKAPLVAKYGGAMKSLMPDSYLELDSLFDGALKDAVTERIEPSEFSERLRGIVGRAQPRIDELVGV